MHRILPLPRLVEPPQPLVLSQYGRAEPGRERLEFFVQAVFQQAYQARVHSFYPILLSLTRPDGDFAAVAGVRPALGEPLFAEHYLDDPIETVATTVLQQRVVRTQVVEVGNLAPAGAGQARWLIAVLTAYLYHAGFDWVTFTAVPALYNAFSRMGLPLTVLAEADPRRLSPAGPDEWGTYYQAGPLVCIGDIRRGYRDVRALLDPGLPRLSALWQAAVCAGARQAGLPVAL